MTELTGSEPVLDDEPLYHRIPDSTNYYLSADDYLSVIERIAQFSSMNSRSRSAGMLELGGSV